jgi:hypothetical protein
VLRNDHVAWHSGNEDRSATPSKRPQQGLATGVEIASAELRRVTATPSSAGSCRSESGPRFVKIGLSIRYLSRDLEEYLADRTVITSEARGRE